MMDIKQSDFQCTNTYVDSFNMVNDMNYKNKTKIMDMQLDYKINDIESSKTNVYFSRAILYGDITGKSDDNEVMKIKISITGEFLGKNVTEDQFIDLIKLNGLLMLSNMLRSYVLSVTALSGFDPPIRIPLINYKESLNNEENFDS